MTLKTITIIAAFMAMISCGGPQKSDQTPADALLGRLEAQKAMESIIDSYNDSRTLEEVYNLAPKF